MKDTTKPEHIQKTDEFISFLQKYSPEDQIEAIGYLKHWFKKHYEERAEGYLQERKQYMEYIENISKI